jgi:SAM-dependent methyltransferase
MWKRRLRWLLQMMRQGHYDVLAVDAGFRLYKGFYSVVFRVLKGRLCRHNPNPGARISLQTKHPVAFASPDHLAPWGTAQDNSTNKKFVLFMAKRLAKESPGRTHLFLDLGCSGGQLVRDFKEAGWTSVGLEGSDYSLKHQRANWPELGNRNLFTCDITKPFHVFVDDNPAKFDLITAWEVLEHIHPSDLDALFGNIRHHLRPGGYFVASTTSSSDVHEGTELHQSRLGNQQWRELIAQRYSDLKSVNLELKYYEYVRFNYTERSFLTYQKI